MGTLCRNDVAGLVHPPIELWTRHDYTLHAQEEIGERDTWPFSCTSSDLHE